MDLRQHRFLAEYNGTNLQGLVTSGGKRAIRNGRCPPLVLTRLKQLVLEVEFSLSTQLHLDEGAYIRGEFNLTAGQELTYSGRATRTGQPDCGWWNGGRRATFVVADTNNTPLGDCRWRKWTRW